MKKHEANIKLSCERLLQRSMAHENEFKVYVGSLNFDTTDQALNDYFSRECGNVVDGKFYFVSLPMVSRKLKIFFF